MASILKHILILILLPCIVWGYGNNQTLEITNIKASGSGSPAISQYNRIFRAYTGITYTIPVGVIGGAYPYVFSLSNAPSGMTIDSHTGVVTWVNPQSSASDIVVTVYDKDGDYTTATWSITVGTSGFIFVDDSAEAGGDGSISTPYDTIDDVLALGSSAVNSIVYFRAGTYIVPMHNGYRTSPGTYGCNLISRAHIWIGYPGESVTLNMGGVNTDYAWWFETHNGISTQTDVWFENVIIQSPLQWGFRHSAGGHYLTFYNITMDDLEGDNIASNCGGLFSQNYGDIYYTYITDSTFSNFATAHHVGSIYDTYKLLIERNTFDTKTGLGASLAVKAHCHYVTIRGNQFASVNASYGHNNNSLFNDTDNIEICYNYVDGGTDVFNIEPPPDEETGIFWFYRNTNLGTIDMHNMDYPDGCEGPWYFDNNAIQNAYGGLDYSHYSNGDNPSSCVDETSNLESDTDTDPAIVDEDGLLVNRSYVGTYGWEIAEDEYYGSSPTPTCQGISIQ